jgi:hypothetical protein
VVVAAFEVVAVAEVVELTRIITNISTIIITIINSSTMTMLALPPRAMESYNRHQLF